MSTSKPQLFIHMQWWSILRMHRWQVLQWCALGGFANCSCTKSLVEGVRRVGRVGRESTVRSKKRIHYDPLTPTSYLAVLAPADGWRVLILRVSNSHPTKSRGKWHTWWIHHKCCVSLYHCSDYASWERSHHFKFRSILDFTVTMGNYLATLVSNPTITVAKYS